MLVAIFVVLVLIALLLPAIQSARESSRRTSCLNNLKQIGTALSHYEATHKVYPRGINGQHWSAQMMLLPHLEQTALYNSFNFNVADPGGSMSDGEVNSTAGRTTVAVFCCPSDPDAGVMRPTTSYAWNGGYGLQSTDFVGSFGGGATRNSRTIKPSDITDGLSNTAAMTEWKVGHYNSSDDTAVVFKIAVRDSEGYSAFVERCQSSNRQTTEFGNWTKKAWWSEGFYNSSLMNFNSPPNSLSCYYGGNIDEGDWPASSYHSKGVNVLFHDNHTQYYRDSTTMRIWNGISTRSGNEIVSQGN